MADILIRGMHFPRNGHRVFRIYADGRVEGEYAGIPLGAAVELPEHGNLIDADSLADDLLYDAELAARALDDTSLVGKEREYAQSEKDIKQNCAYYVSHAPVIVPANKEESK